MNHPTDREYLVEEIRHLATPDPDWSYGHQFRRQEDGTSKCRCGFTLTPISQRSPLPLQEQEAKQ